jgi:cytochrome c oxidase subunit 3
MQKRYQDELSPEVKLKMKKNLLYVSIFSIVMIFAGLTSGYIVSAGDVFWVKYPLPSAFWISTGLIFISSITYYFAVRLTKGNQHQKVRIPMLITLFLGIGFLISQIIGYKQLIKEGSHFTFNPIIVTEGRYGDYYEIKYNGKFIEVNGNDYLLDGKIMREQDYKKLQDFMKPFENMAQVKGYSIQKLDPHFVLYYEGEPLSVQKNQLVSSSGKVLKYVEMERLMYLAYNIRDKRGDFFHKGELGKDFHLYYKGKELSYKNRDLYFGNRKLSAPLQLKINQSTDTASSYLYIITILHFLHVFFTIFYLFRMVLISFKPTLTFDNQLSIRLGSIFWHFLGILWLFLLVFLLFIH